MSRRSLMWRHKIRQAGGEYTRVLPVPASSDGRTKRWRKGHLGPGTATGRVGTRPIGHAKLERIREYARAINRVR